MVSWDIPRNSGALLPAFPGFDTWLPLRGHEEAISTFMSPIEYFFFALIYLVIGWGYSKRFIPSDSYRRSSTRRVRLSLHGRGYQGYFSRDIRCWSRDRSLFSLDSLQSFISVSSDMGKHRYIRTCDGPLSIYSSQGAKGNRRINRSWPTSRVFRPA